MVFDWLGHRSRQARDERLFSSGPLGIAGLSHLVAILLHFCRLIACGLPRGDGF